MPDHQFDDQEREQLAGLMRKLLLSTPFRALEPGGSEGISPYRQATRAVTVALDCVADI